MELHSCILTKNDCYQRGVTIVPKGVMVHSTGANNPWLKRYVQPDDGELGKNLYGNDWNRSGLDVCVHAFIGKKQDGGVATYQTLPWNRRGWHAGGAANNTHISFEICEDGLTDRNYFETVYREAAELTAYLCGLYGLDPLQDGVVICHAEGYRRGLASNHGDVEHWFPKFGKTMNDFRNQVKQIMEGDEMSKEEIQALVDARIKEILSGDKTVPSQWAKEELGAAISDGITDGSRPGGYATREEAAVMVERLYRKVKP